MVFSDYDDYGSILNLILLNFCFSGWLRRYDSTGCNCFSGVLLMSLIQDLLGSSCRIVMCCNGRSNYCSSRNIVEFLKQMNIGIL